MSSIGFENVQTMSLYTHIDNQYLWTCLSSSSTTLVLSHRRKNISTLVYVCPEGSAGWRWEDFISMCSRWLLLSSQPTGCCRMAVSPGGPQLTSCEWSWGRCDHVSSGEGDIWRYFLWASVNSLSFLTKSSIIWLTIYLGSDHCISLVCPSISLFL